MFKKIALTVLILCSQIFIYSQNLPYIAGFRASRILSHYPDNEFPSEEYWVNTGIEIASKFDSTAPAGIWIVSLYQDNGITQLNFPTPGGTYPYIQFISEDQNETYLTNFDSAGFYVWLQVEPGAANIDTLISLVLNRYNNHPCVKGFGIDVEWLNAQDYSGGQHVTDSMAQHWEQSVKAINPDYTLFLKHYSKSWMPPVYRGEIIFVDDSQDFPSLNSMVSEFSEWGSFFAPNKVAFQYGYPIDEPWWSQYVDPMLTIGNALKTNIANCYGLFWVDFTICDVFPIITYSNEYFDKNTPFIIHSVNPNPFTTSAIINLELLRNMNITIEMYDNKGQRIKIVDDGYKSKGIYKILLYSENMKTGVYYCLIRAGKYEKNIELSFIK